MKYFKCGKCQVPYKIDETKVTTTQVVVKCPQCRAKNILRFGPLLIAQTKDKQQVVNLKMGPNRLGRQSKQSLVDFSFTDEYISRKHATVYLEGKAEKLFVSIEDNGSLNGTYNKNKDRLKPGVRYPFTTNDYFVIGLTKISLKIN